MTDLQKEFGGKQIDLADYQKFFQDRGIEMDNCGEQASQHFSLKY